MAIDAPAYFEAVDANRVHLSQFGDTTADKYTDLQSVVDSLEQPTDPDKLLMGIWDGENFVGAISLTPIEDGAEIGYWLDGHHTGHGYATLAVKALGSYAAKRYPQVYANVIEGNETSSRVLQRAGFRQVAQKAGRLVFELEATRYLELNQGVVIREVQANDLKALQPILEQWIRNRDTGSLRTKEVGGIMASIETSLLGTAGRKYVVAEDREGKLMGLMGMMAPRADMKAYVSSDKPIELINAYVDKTRRGTGAGTLLVNRLEELAIQAGYTEIIVNSGPRYEHTGWAFWTKLYGEPIAVQKDLYGPGSDAPVWAKSLTITT